MKQLVANRSGRINGPKPGNLGHSHSNARLAFSEAFWIQHLTNVRSSEW